MDPWNWTVDDVVNAFCVSRELWADRPGFSLPDPQNLEVLLRSNYVDGATLLEHLDKATLRDNFNITPIGHQASILFAIEALRDQSSRWRQYQIARISRENGLQESTAFSPPPSLLSSVAAKRDASIFDTPSANNGGLLPTSEAPNTLSISKPPAAATPTARKGEVLILGSDGQRKRRRLDLTKPTEPSDFILSTFGKRSGNGYLKEGAFSVDELFFGMNRDFDHDLLEDAGIVPFDNFSFLRLGIVPLGSESFVGARMRHFLLQGPDQLDESTVAIFPYPERLISQSRGRSALLFEHINGEIRVSKRDAVMLRSDIVYEEGDNENHEWDWLGKWTNQPEDEELPLYGDSEAEYDEWTMTEIDKEEAENEALALRKHNLSSSEVEFAIDAAAIALKEKWTESMLPLREWKAWRLWRRAKGRRPAFRSAARAVIERLTARLEKLKQSMKDEQWTNLEQIRKQSLCMEQTIFDLQHQFWRIGVLDRKHPPGRPATKPPPKKQTITQENDEDCEVLDSESDESDNIIDYDSDIDEPGLTGINTDHIVPIDDPTDTDIDKVDQESYSTPPETPVPVTTSKELVETLFPDFTPDDESRRGPIDLINVLPGYLPVETSTDPPSDHQIPPPDVIDLTVSSPDAGSYSDYVKPVERIVPLVNFHNNPGSEPVAEIKRWHIGQLEERRDRKRLVLKIFLEKLSFALRNQIKRHILVVPLHELAEQVKNCLRTLKEKKRVIDGLEQAAFETLEAITRLFVCWVISQNKYNAVIDAKYFDNAIKATTPIASNIEPFIQFFKDLMDMHEDYDDELGPPALNTPHKRRVKRVKESQTTRTLQNNAQLRLVEGQKREKELIEEIEATSLAAHEYGIIINSETKLKDEDIIYINPLAGSRIKKHQIEGVKFMWRELVTTAASPELAAFGPTAEEESGSLAQGCLLAHTMGLGKTMQTITLLVTIAESARSSNPAVVKQIPEPLRNLRTLILCPPGLIGNWLEELRLWVPATTVNIRPFSSVTSADQGDERYEKIARWFDRGGVLIMGYDMFRKFIQYTADTVSDQVKTKAKEQLLHGPGIVVADEAHKLKNLHSKVSLAASQFKTRSRIALTGSPLSNNLADYYAMIHWVAPYYLGDEREFRARYQEPIQEGFYVDSEPDERRKALKRLKVLASKIEPKVHRADTSVLKNDLPPRTEFVIKIPLTSIQRQVYSLFVQSLASDSERVANTRLWAWMHWLALLCNHPKSFLMKLEQRKSKVSTPPVAESGDDDDRQSLPGDGDASELGIPDTWLQKQMSLLQGVANLDAVEHSHKMAIVFKILEEAKTIGDKTLLFSHNIPTLSYLETTLRARSFRFKRLDGTTNMSDRLAMSKEFNLGAYDVFLISTRAGGLGINLPGANRVILVDFNFNPTWEEQAIGRAYRIGQEKEVFVYHFVVGGTFEETVHNKAMFKTQLAFRVVDNKKLERCASKTRDFLFEPREVRRDDDVPLFIGKDRIMDSVISGGYEVRGLSTTETMHREIEEDLTKEEEAEVETMKHDEKMRTRNPALWKHGQALAKEYRRPPAGTT